MKSKITFTKKDFVVVFGCVVFLLANIGAVSSGGRKRAKEVVCLSNLRQWGAVFAMDVEENDGYFYSGQGSAGYWWIRDLDEAYRDWKSMRIWFCPQAKRPLIDEHGKPTGELSVFSAWGIFSGMDLGPNGIAGSYGINGYVLAIPTNGTFEGGVPARDGWRTPNVPGAGDVPVFLDALRLDLWPLEEQPPAGYEFAAWTGNSMARCCINRHNGSINGLFMDWSARKIGLKELWTLNWHRSFNACGPWTKCGGVQSEDWPQWMRNLKDY